MLAVGLLAAFLPLSAAAEIVARVSLGAQTMQVFENGQLLHEWPVSTARPGKVTPRGVYTAQWLSANHRSSLYDNAPMPWSIFFHGHYAIHGTDQISRLGRPASAGCVRLHPENARLLFGMARAAGLENMRVVIVD
ncbi:MAG: L,D-transpeptidase [Rhodobacteraceae bacterium]|nr:L,D-transpeptidase [Paracoccaceae bacterium]